MVLSNPVCTEIHPSVLLSSSQCCPSRQPQTAVQCSGLPLEQGMQAPLVYRNTPLGAFALSPVLFKTISVNRSRVFGLAYGRWNTHTPIYTETHPGVFLASPRRRPKRHPTSLVKCYGLACKCTAWRCPASQVKGFRLVHKCSLPRDSENLNKGFQAPAQVCPAW